MALVATPATDPAIALTKLPPTIDPKMAPVDALAPAAPASVPRVPFRAN